MIIFPISDDNDEGFAWHHHDFIHWGLIFFCIIAFCFETYLVAAGGQQGLEDFINQWSFDPRVLGDDFLALSFPVRAVKLAEYLVRFDNFGILQMLASTFIHGGLMHLFGNLFVLWMLGDNVEYAMGHLRYLLFFLVAGIISSYGDIVFATAATFRGGIGASGAIMAVAGAYLFYFPKARINFFYLVGFWWGVFSVPARLVIGVYILTQIAEAIGDYGTSYDNVGVWAHVTGFLLGMLLAWPLRRNRDEPLSQPRSREAYRRSLRQAMRDRQERRKSSIGRFFNE